MNIVDIIVGAILLYGAYKGFSTGLLLSLISFISFFAAILVAINFSGRISAHYIERYPDQEAVIPLVVFFICFLLVILALTITGRVFKKIIDLTILGGLDTLAGAIFGVAKWAFIISTTIWLFSFVGLNISEGYFENSILLPVLEPVAPIIFQWVSYIIPGIEDWLTPFKEMDFKEDKHFTLIF